MNLPDEGYGGGPLKSRAAWRLRLLEWLRRRPQSEVTEPRGTGDSAPCATTTETTPAKEPAQRTRVFFDLP